MSRYNQHPTILTTPTSAVADRPEVRLVRCADAAELFSRVQLSRRDAVLALVHYSVDHPGRESVGKWSHAVMTGDGYVIAHDDRDVVKPPARSVLVAAQRIVDTYDETMGEAIRAVSARRVALLTGQIDASTSLGGYTRALLQDWGIPSYSCDLWLTRLLGRGEVLAWWRMDVSAGHLEDLEEIAEGVGATAIREIGETWSRRT